MDGPGSLSVGMAMRIWALSLAGFLSKAGWMSYTEVAFTSPVVVFASSLMSSMKVKESDSPTSMVWSAGQQTYLALPGVPAGPDGPSIPKGAHSPGTSAATVPGGIRTMSAAWSSLSWFWIQPGPSLRSFTVTDWLSPASASVSSPTATRSAVLFAVRVSRRWLSVNPSPGTAPVAEVPYSTASISALGRALNRTGVSTEAPGSITVSSSQSACLTWSSTVE